ncbi:hypothetical protein DSUL_40121 [Desulfovibrionales bacterium]
MWIRADEERPSLSLLNRRCCAREGQGWSRFQHRQTGSVVEKDFFACFRLGFSRLGFFQFILRRYSSIPSRTIS